MILADTAAFPFVPVGVICGTPPVPGTVNSGGKTVSIFRVYFRSVPFYSLPETAGISLEYTKDPGGSGRIRETESSTWDIILPTISDEYHYFTLRRQVLTISTKSEHARANRIASQMDPSQINSTMDPLVKAKLPKRQQKDQSIIVPYTDERRFANYKSKIHQIWNVSFPAYTCIQTKLIIGTRNNPNLTKELVCRSP
jgi:hypothetical protein